MTLDLEIRSKIKSRRRKDNGFSIRGFMTFS